MKKRKNGGGKPKFSNEAARRAEVTRRLTTEPAYAAAARTVTDTTTAWIQSKIAVEQIEDEHRAAVAIERGVLIVSEPGRSTPDCSFLRRSDLRCVVCGG